LLPANIAYSKSLLGDLETLQYHFWSAEKLELGLVFLVNNKSLKKVKTNTNYEALAVLNNKFNSICCLHGFRVYLSFYRLAVQMGLFIAARG
jgi:hypothetical protein